MGRTIIIIERVEIFEVLQIFLYPQKLISSKYFVDLKKQFDVLPSAEQYTGFVIIPQYYFPIPSNFLNIAVP